MECPNCNNKLKKIYDGIMEEEVLYCPNCDRMFKKNYLLLEK